MKVNGVKNAIMKWRTFWVAPCLICYSFVILLYIERKWLFTRKSVTIFPFKSELSRRFQHFNAIDRSIKILKIVEFSKISIRMKNCKTFCKAEAASHHKEVFQQILTPNHPTPYQIKPLLHLWNKRFLKEICRNI